MPVPSVPGTMTVPEAPDPACRSQDQTRRPDRSYISRVASNTAGPGRLHDTLKAPRAGFGEAGPRSVPDSGDCRPPSIPV
ncbi:MAG: hypothetical protein BWX47_01879 [candidate division Hyd24-12 bacterium ADurb.Bin004]|nr:MAG: hypothetical protein BWX47_01879 [candidate division Hyd24-12 bacterium ADurb.Bin004]